MYRAIVLYFAVQSAVVASPASGLQHSDQIGTGTFYHPTPAYRARTLPDVSKLPRPSATAKKLGIGGSATKLTPVNNYAMRKSRVPALDPPHRHISNIFSNEPHQKIQRPSVSNEERAEKINSDLEKMIQFMTVLGQVDRYLSSRAKSFVTTLGRAIENGNNDQDIYNDRDNVMSSFEY